MFCESRLKKKIQKSHREMDLLQTKEAIEALLDKFQDTPILWNSKHSLYCNKDVRAAALEEQQTICKHGCQDALPTW